MANEITLRDFAYRQLDYIEAMNENNGVLEGAINLILGQLTGQSGSLSVPLGLQEIFDRRGLIGIDAYDFTAGVLTGPSYNLSVAAGAYWNAGTFYHKTAITALSMAGQPDGTYYVNLDAAGNPKLSTSPDATTTRQFTWTASSHTVSAKALYPGVAILFDGTDYADMLTSAARSKTFTKVADRLEEIEALLARGVQTPAPADTINLNWSLGSLARIVLDRPTTTINMSGGFDSQKCVLELIQDGNGGRAVALGTGVQVGTDLTVPVPLSVTGGKRDFLGFVFSDSNVGGGNGKFNYVSLSRGF